MHRLQRYFQQTKVDKVPTHKARSETIVCTLTSAELADTGKAWRKLLSTALVVREEIPGGLRLEVNEESADALRQLVDIERECCRWITFNLEGPVVSMTAPGPGAFVIRGMWGL
jgi:hypothetical protein